MSAVVPFKFVDLRDTVGKAALQIEWRANEPQFTQDRQVNIFLGKLGCIAFKGRLNKCEPLLNEFSSYAPTGHKTYNAVGKASIK